MDIHPFNDSQLDAIVQIALRAWEPVFQSLETVMDPEVYREQFPDWRETQKNAVTKVCKDQDVHVWVAMEGTQIVGFVALKVHSQDRMGEIYMIAVDPDFQRQGIATALTNHSLAWFQRVGMTTVMVETGGDPGHAPPVIHMKLPDFDYFQSPDISKNCDTTLTSASDGRLFIVWLCGMLFQRPLIPDHPE